MTFEEFSRLANAYGADFDRWPVEQRASATRFATDHAEQVAPVLAEARRLDALLNTVDVSPPSDLLKARILKAARETTPDNAPLMETAPHRSAMPWGRMAAAMAVTFALGFAGGQLTQAPAPEQAPVLVAETTPDDLTVTDGWAEAATLLAMDDIYAWSEGTETDETDVLDL